MRYFMGRRRRNSHQSRAGIIAFLSLTICLFAAPAPVWANSSVFGPLGDVFPEVAALRKLDCSECHTNTRPSNNPPPNARTTLAGFGRRLVEYLNNSSEIDYQALKSQTYRIDSVDPALIKKGMRDIERYFAPKVTRVEARHRNETTGAFESLGTTNSPTGTLTLPGSTDQLKVSFDSGQKAFHDSGSEITDVGLDETTEGIANVDESPLNPVEIDLVEPRQRGADRRGGAQPYPLVFNPVNGDGFRSKYNSLATNSFGVRTSNLLPDASPDSFSPAYSQLYDSAGDAMDYPLNVLTKSQDTDADGPKTSDGQYPALRVGPAAPTLSASYGSVRINDGATGYVYTPPATLDAAERSITFQYSAVDGEGGESDPVTVTLQLPADIPPPVVDLDARDDDFTIDEGESLSGADVKANDDLDGKPLSEVTFDADDVPNGTLSFDSATGLFDYTPEPDFSGTVSFGYVLQGGGDADEAIVTINVNAVNDPPEAEAIALRSRNEAGGPIVQNLLDPGSVTDRDGDMLSVSDVSYSVAFRPSGALDPIEDDAIFSLDGSDLTISLAALSDLDNDEFADLTVSYTISDGSAPGPDGPVTNTLTLTVIGLDNGLGRQAGAYADTLSDRYLSVPYGAHFRGQELAPSACFTCHLNAEVLDVDVDTRDECVQTPAVFNQYGLDLCLDRSASTPALEDLPRRLRRAEKRYAPTLLPVDTIEIAESTPKGSPVGAPMTASDPGLRVDGARSEIVTYLIGRKIDGADPMSEDESGQFSIGSDGQIKVNTDDLQAGAHTLVVLPVNDAGQRDGSERPRPDIPGFYRNEPGSESFVTILVLPESPVATDDRANTSAGRAVTLDVLKNDEGGEVETLSIATPPANGEATIGSDRTITYAPARGFIGTDSFTYRAGNAEGASEATVTIEVLTPGAVVASDDDTVTTQGQAVRIDVLANDRNATASTTLSIASPPDSGQGTAVVQGREIVFAPAETFLGTASFRYTARGPDGGSSATVRVEVLELGAGTIAGAVTDPRLKPVARAFDESCGIVNGSAGLRSEGGAFLKHCVNLTLAARSGEDIDQAMRALRNEEHLAVADLTATVARGLGGVVSRRLERLRRGPARGFDVGGVSLTVAGKRVPTEFVTRLGQALSGVAPENAPGAEFLPPKASRNWGLFIAGDISYSDKDSTDTAEDYELTTTNLLAGLDFALGPYSTLGFAFGYSQAETDFSGGGSLDADGLQATLYGLRADPARPGLSFEGYLSVGRMDFDSDRRIRFTSNGAEVDTAAIATFRGTYLNVAPRISYSQSHSGGGAGGEGPFAGLITTVFGQLDYLVMDIDGYSESGGDGLALDVDPTTYESLLLSVGVEARKPVFLIPDAAQEVFGSLALSGELLDGTRTLSASFAAAGAAAPSFVVAEDGARGLRAEIEVGSVMSYRGHDLDARYGYDWGAGGLSTHRLSLQYSRQVFGSDRFGVGVSRDITASDRDWSADMEYELRF